MPGEAARELERCVRTLGFKEATLCGRVDGRNLDHPSFASIFQSAAALQVLVSQHEVAYDRVDHPARIVEDREALKGGDSHGGDRNISASGGEAGRLSRNRR